MWYGWYYLWQKGEAQNGCFKKTKHAKFSEKRTFLTPAYQGVRNIRFSESLACFVFLKHPFWDLPFCLITDDMLKHWYIEKNFYVVSCHSFPLFNKWRRGGRAKKCHFARQVLFTWSKTNYGRDLLCNKYICLEKEGICKYFWQRSHRCFPWLSGFYNVLPNFVLLVKSRATCDHGNVIEN